jgi:hypothetical protein
MTVKYKELAEQAGFMGYGEESGTYSIPVKAFESRMETLAELIVRECAENFAKVWYEQGLDIRGAELDKFMKRFEKMFGGNNDNVSNSK